MVIAVAAIFITNKAGAIMPPKPPPPIQWTVMQDVYSNGQMCGYEVTYEFNMYWQAVEVSRVLLGCRNYSTPQ